MPESTATTRPTPEQIIDPLEFTPGQVLAALAEHGYVIVHPDDVPSMDGDDPLYLDSPYGAGFNDCHARIFGADQ